MNKVMNFLLVGLVTAAALVFFVVLGTLMGALTGWIVGWFFADTILAFLAALGITGFKMWQVGAALGFIGSFFRSRQAVTQNKG